MGLKNHLMLSLIAVCIVLVMLSGIAAADNLTVNLNSLSNGNHTYTTSSFSNYNPSDYLILSGTLSGTIIINSDLNVILNGVTITQRSDNQSGAFVIGDGRSVNIYLADGSVNTITGLNGTDDQATTIRGAGKAGIYVPAGSTLTIDAILVGGGTAAGNGQLIAKGGTGTYTDFMFITRATGSGAGIGGRGGYDSGGNRDGSAVGSIIIKNGIVTAIGGAKAPGNTNAVSPGRDIGGGSGAYRNDASAGDGAGGYGGSVQLIKIEGGTVNAVTYGIGGGHGGDKKGSSNGGGNGGLANIEISGGTVYASSPDYPAIGGGNGGDSGPSYNHGASNNQGYGGEVNIEITGGEVYVPTGPSDIGAGTNGGYPPSGDPSANSNVNLGSGFVKTSGYAYFHANGGTYSDDAYSNGVYSLDAQTTQALGDVFDESTMSFGTVELTGPEGSAFAGWFIESDVRIGNHYYVTDDLKSAVDSGDIILVNTKYYAIWTYDITLDLNDGYGLVDSPVTIQNGHDWNDIDALIVAAGTPFRDDNWAYGGWWSAESGDVINGVIDKDTAIPWDDRDLDINPIIGPETFYALWKGTLTLDPNGESLWIENTPTKIIDTQPGMTYDDVMALIDDVINLMGADGWTEGWYTECTNDYVYGSSGPKFVDLDTKFNGGLLSDDIFYFAWVTEVTLDANGGTFSDGNDLTTDDPETISIEVQRGQAFDAADFAGYQTAENGDWDASYWYQTAENGFVSTRWIDGDFFEADSMLYVGWFSTIILNANGGVFEGYDLNDDFNDDDFIPFEIQAGQTLGDLDLTAYKVAVYDDWEAIYWYISDTGGIVSILWEDDDVLEPGNALFVGWFGDIILNANSGTFGDLGDETEPVSIQAANTFDEINALIATALDAKDPVNGNWEPYMWYTDVTGGIVAADDEWTENSGALGSGASLYVGWFGDIILNANGGVFEGYDLNGDFNDDDFIPFEIQAGQILGDLDLTAYKVAVYDDWEAMYWYISDTGGIVSTLWEDDDVLEPGNVLFVGWFGDIILNANGGTFGDLGDETEPVSIQAANTFDEINALIATALDAKDPVNGNWEPYMWYTDVTNGIVAADDEWTENSDALVSGASLYVGWFGNIILNANGGVFEGYDLNGDSNDDDFIPFGIQAGQTLGDFDLTAYKVAVYDDWEAKYWYVSDTGGIVSTLWEDDDVLEAGNVFYVGWFSTIILNANGGTFGDLGDETEPVSIQAAHTFTEINDLIAIALDEKEPVNGDWASDMWYTDVTDGLVAANDKWTANSGALVSGASLYVGWFGDIILNANGGRFGDLGDETEPVSIQAANTFDEINALIETALDAKDPVNGNWEPYMWYTDVTNGIVAADDEWTENSDALGSGASLYVGWFGFATFDASPGAFLGNNNLQIGPGTSEYIMEGIQPGQNVLNLIPASELSGHRLSGWIFEDETHWPSFFEENGQIVYALWESIGGNGNSGNGYSEAKIVEAASSGGSIESGGDVTGAAPKDEPKDADPQPPTPEKKSNTIWYILLLLILLLLLAGGAYYYFKTKK